MVSSRSDETVTATVAVRNLGGRAERRTLELTLGPRQTRVVTVPQAMVIDGFGGQPWKAGSVTIEHTGAPGEVLARGRMEDRAVRYAGVVEFSDPAADGSSELHGTGLRLGRLEERALVPVLVVRNTAAEPVELTVGLPWSGMFDGTRTVELRPVRLEAGEVRDLSRALGEAVGGLPMDQWRSAGLELRWTGPPGAVVAAAQAVSLDGEYALRVPLVDPATKGSAGNYPWRLDGDTTTWVYLKNTSREVQSYTVQVDFAGGGYVLGLRELEPGETTVVDLRELRDSGRADEHGTVLPPDAAEGQVHWSVIGAANHVMVGRAEYVDRRHGLVTTFACSSCCPDSYSGAWASPAGMLLPITSYDTLNAFQQNMNCYGQLLMPFQFYPIWSSSDPSILGVTSGGTATGLSPGMAQGIAPRIVCVHSYRLMPAPGCYSNCFTIAVASQAEVPHPVLTGPASVTRGQNARFEILNLGAAAVPQWTFVGGGATVQKSGGHAWEGTMAVGGVVKAQVSGLPQPLQRSIAVNPRSGWTTQAVAAQKVANGSAPELTVPNPPTDPGPGNTTAVAKSHLNQAYSVPSAAIGSGPNQGFKYATSPPSNNTTYRWVLTQQLDSTSGQFYQAQCGNYHPQTNPSGFISGAALRSNAIHHESANAPNSHYYQYRVAQDDPSNNIANAVEAVVAAPAEVFGDKRNAILVPRLQAIQDAAAVEPCGGVVNRDHSSGCAPLGNINYLPYQPCP
jgi:hypothetical protein